MDGPLTCDEDYMLRAAALAAGVRGTTAPNPWVGCLVVSGDDPTVVFEGAT
jgi:pyrimidine deaminase RibD-like protein